MSTINGTSGNDVLDGTDLADTIFAGDGDDIVNGADGDDTIYGNAGSDISSFIGFLHRAMKDELCCHQSLRGFSLF